MKERTGFRTLVYSRWHRPDKIRALLGAVKAFQLTMIDIDSCEACAYCNIPVALIETEHTTRSHPKKAPITALLAKMARIEAYSVAYSGDIDRTHCGTCDRDDEVGEPSQFLVQRIEPPNRWVDAMTPKEYAEFLLSLREGHTCSIACDCPLPGEFPCLHAEGRAS